MSDGYIVIIESDDGFVWETEAIFDIEAHCSSVPISDEVLKSGYRRNVYSLTFLKTLDPAEGGAHCAGYKPVTRDNFLDTTTRDHA